MHVAAMQRAGDCAYFELEDGCRADIDEGLQVDARGADADAGGDDDHRRHVFNTEFP